MAVDKEKIEKVLSQLPVELQSLWPARPRLLLTGRVPFTPCSEPGIVEILNQPTTIVLTPTSLVNSRALTRQNSECLLTPLV